MSAEHKQSTMTHCLESHCGINYLFTWKIITKNNKHGFCQKQTIKEAESAQWTPTLALEPTSVLL